MTGLFLLVQSIEMLIKKPETGVLKRLEQIRDNQIKINLMLMMSKNSI